MTTKQLNRYAEMVVVCNGDRRYGGEVTFEDNVLVSVLAGELKVVQADHTHWCGPGDTLLLPRNQPATLLKYPAEGAAYQAVLLKLPTALVRAYYTQHAPAAGPASRSLLLFSKSPLLKRKTSVLDVLVNNAGISGGLSQSVLHDSLAQYRAVFETNVFGVAGVTQAFIDLLQKSPQPRIVNVSSAMASLALYADLANEHFAHRYPVYQSSKTALNMYTVNLAHALRDTAFKVNAVCPGYTKTDFTGHQGTSTVAEAGQRIVKYALLGPDGPTGKYFSEEYFPAPVTCPW